MDFLKLHLGTLFLSTYYLPTEKEVKARLSRYTIHPFSKFPPFESVESVLEELFQKILHNRKYLVKVSKIDHGFRFKKIMKNFDESICPTDLNKSAWIFFEKFFERDLTPTSNEEVEEIAEWILYVVKFNEADRKRVEQALVVIEEIKLHLTTMRIISKVHNDPEREHIEWLKREKKKHGKWSKIDRDDVDDKTCSCFDLP